MNYCRPIFWRQVPRSGGCKQMGPSGDRVFFVQGAAVNLLYTAPGRLNVNAWAAILLVLGNAAVFRSSTGYKGRATRVLERSRSYFCIGVLVAIPASARTNRCS